MITVHQVNGRPWFEVLDANEFYDIQAAEKVIAAALEKKHFEGIEREAGLHKHYVEIMPKTGKAAQRPWFSYSKTPTP